MLYFELVMAIIGVMAEWTMAVVLKTTVAAMSPGVRIPLTPP